MNAFKKIQSFLKNFKIISHSGLARQIVFYIFLNILVIELILLIPSIQNRENEMKNHMREKIDLTLQNIDFENPRFSPNDLLSKIVNIPKTDIDAISLYDSNGVLLSSTEKIIPFNSTMTEGIFTFFQTEFFLHKIELTFHNEKVILFISHDLKNSQNEIRDFIVRILELVAIISIFVALGTLIILNNILILPVLELRKDLNRAGNSLIKKDKKDTMEFVSTKYNQTNELREVIDTFRIMYNQVFDEIQKRSKIEERLEELNLELERRVTDRTLELQNINRKLRVEIEEREIIEKLLRYNAYHDELTGLGNRLLLIESINNKIIEKSNKRFSVLLFDIDNFKIVNDSLGHGLGNKILIEVSLRIKSILEGSGSLLVRLGGDEFTILVDYTNQDEVSAIAEKISGSMKIPFHVEGHEIFITVSIGIAHYFDEYENAEDMIRDADLVMYRAKELGKARIEYYDFKMREQILDNLDLQTELRKSVRNIIDLDHTISNEFFLVYQPIINFQTRKLEGFEALIRWQHPKRGLVSPIQFISKAEESGDIIPLGYWIIKTACNQLVEWKKKFGDINTQISVNLSGRQLRENLLPRLIIGHLQKNNLKPSLLKLELTESAIVEETQIARKMFLELKNIGIKLSMDDFGTGYSSLSYLHQFPFDTIKIDQSFVNRMENGGREIIKTIITMAKSLGMDVVAEGVETKEQKDKLIELDCHFGQGYYFSRPLTASQAEEFIRENLNKNIV
ncbi:MAG: EAL domain-containing protein [Leptospiraceae bacterium]|nr:EAL domain-containing protein [Leptospiraceae bacterium]MCP5512964.1 EAL domain-containing protein [Leptospiraceae bacterium]